MNSLVREAAAVGQLRAEAAELGEWVKSARLLRSPAPVAWKQLPREVIQHILTVVISWTEGVGRDVQVLRPASVSQGNYLLRHTTLRLSQVLLWALAGLLTEEERRALAAR